MVIFCELGAASDAQQSILSTNVSYVSSWAARSNARGTSGRMEHLLPTKHKCLAALQSTTFGFVLHAHEHDNPHEHVCVQENGHTHNMHACAQPQAQRARTGTHKHA